MRMDSQLLETTTQCGDMNLGCDLLTAGALQEVKSWDEEMNYR